jgi:release factor glutamine methyltransferase
VTLRQALVHAREMLAAAPKDVEDPSLESEVLLKHILQVDRASLYLELERELAPEAEARFFQWIERRVQGEPLAYIIQCREFYGLDFYVDSRVLIPRPESELLVEQALCFARRQPVSIVADVGTGSGAIAVSLAINLPRAKIYATDISATALEVAKTNSQEHGVAERIVFLQGDLLGPIPEPADLLIANLPYVKKFDLAGMPSAVYEPAIALDGGESGLDQIFRFCRQLEGRVRSSGCVLLEIGMGQSRAVTEFLHSQFPSAAIGIIPDLAGIERVVKITLKM